MLKGLERLEQQRHASDISYGYAISLVLYFYTIDSGVSTTSAEYSHTHEQILCPKRDMLQTSLTISVFTN